MQEPFIPRGTCTVPMLPELPAGCAPGYEPYVHRTKQMLQAGDTFDPCCKATGCKEGDDVCQQQIDTRWAARVVRFAETAQYISTRLLNDIKNVQNMTQANHETLTLFFQQHKDLHEVATIQLQEYFEVTNVIIRDLERCTKVLMTIVDNNTVVPKATVTPRGREFDVMRAEAVGSGCASLETLLAIARAEYFPRYLKLAELLNDAISGYRRTQLVGRYRSAKYNTQRVWLMLLDNVQNLMTHIKQVNVRTMAFYMFTLVPFLYTSALTMSAAVPAMLMANSKLPIFMRSLKLFCHFTQLPGLVMGLSVVLSNKLLVYLRFRQNQQRVDDEVAKGAVTFFSLLEKFVNYNPTAAVSIATLGAARAGTTIASYTAASIASLGSAPEIHYMGRVLQGILMFFMTTLSSSLWKSVGFACKTTAKVATPAMEGTASLISGSATLLGGITHLAAQLFSAAGQTVGYGFDKAGIAADALGYKINELMDSMSVDAAIREKLSQADESLEESLSTMDAGILSILGVTAESLTENLHIVFDPNKVQAVEQFIRTAFQSYGTELRLLLWVLPLIYKTWTWFQPLTDINNGLSTLIAEAPEIEHDATEYVKRYGRIIPRPPINFVFQQCLREDPERIELCQQRAEEWSGFKGSPPSENQPPPDYTPRRRGSGRRRRYEW